MANLAIGFRLLLPLSFTPPTTTTTTTTNYYYYYYYYYYYDDDDDGDDEVRLAQRQQQLLRLQPLRLTVLLGLVAFFCECFVLLALSLRDFCESCEHY